MGSASCGKRSTREDVEAIRRDTDALGETIQKIGSSVYQQAPTEQPKPEGDAGSTPPPEPGWR